MFVFGAAAAAAISATSKAKPAAEQVAEIEAEGNARRDAMLAVKALHVACLNGEMTHEELVVQVEQYMQWLGTGPQRFSTGLCLDRP